MLASDFTGAGAGPRPWRTATRALARNLANFCRLARGEGSPYHDRDGFIWYDGKLVAWREANLHVLSHGLNCASAVFEGERAYGGEISRSPRDRKSVV